MASLEGQQENYSNNPAVENIPKRPESREGSAERKASKDREEKLKYARDRQNEERQRKIEELRAQAEAAQKYREQKEEERRRRIDEIRVRDTEKRHLVEERKKAIIEAEKERREYILKKNLERESRIEVKKRDRNSIAFAFGSSTPRLLDVPADYGLVSPSQYWGQRRSTSISNVAGTTLSRRSSERELADSGANKKRTSSSTDRHDGSRSGNVTPGGHGHLSGSRPGSAMSNSTTLSTAGLVPRRPATAPRKPRPASIAGTGMSLEEINKLKRDNKPPVKTTAASPSTTSTAQTTPKRTANLMSTSMIVTSSSSRMNSAEKKTPSKREPLPKAASASKAQPSRTASTERIGRQPKCPPSMSTSMIVNSSSNNSIGSTTAVTTTVTTEAAPAVEANGITNKETKELLAEVAVTAPVAVVSKAEKEARNNVKTEQVKQEPVQVEQVSQSEPVVVGAVELELSVPEPTVAAFNVEEKADEGNEKPHEATIAAPKKTARELTPPSVNALIEGNDLMTASMIARKITTEEQAKAALAERRRLAREEAERQAELERQRLEAERLAELKAQEEEAERQRLFEEESTRLAEQQRRGEEERLRKAIEEAQQREKEEQRMREDEERQRIERDEAEKKAKEEAEKNRVEVAERLKREEKEREERRKRVEAIMLRTRKGGAAGTPAKESNDASKTATAPKESSDSNSSSSNSAGGSPSSSTDAAAPIVPIAIVDAVELAEPAEEPPNSQAMYEQSVLDKENSLINSFSNMIIDENAKNLQQFEVSNGKLHVETTTTTTATTIPAAAVANGNGHIENVNNKNDINLLQDAVTPAVTQLIDLSIESQDIHINNNNNNNSLLTSAAATTTNTLVTADSHDNKDISLL